MKTISMLGVGLLFVSLTTTAKAQIVDLTDHFPRFEFGIRLMPTISNFQMQTYSGGTVKGEATFGYGAGAMIAFNFTKNFGLQSEVLYNSLSQKYKDAELDRIINVRYVNIPLMLALNTGKQNRVNLNLVFGPQIGVSLGSSITKTGSGDVDTITYVYASKTTDFGVAYGAGLDFTLNERKTVRLDIGFRGVYGLINVSDVSKPVDDNSTYIVELAKIRTKSAYIGFTFLF